MDDATIFSKVLEAQIQHTRFLNATQKYITYYFYGKDISLVNDKVFPEIDVVNLLESYSADPQNPLQYVAKQFIEEITTSEFATTVNPFPVIDKEPYESYADNLEDYLINLHRISKRKAKLKMAVFELLVHGYFGLYTNGKQYWFLTAYDFIPGDPKVLELQDQPFIIRKTRASESYMRSIGANLKNLNPLLDGIPNTNGPLGVRQYGLYDIWIKDLDLNICFTEAGEVAYKQSFAHPKRYPFTLGRTSELLNSFYPIPIMSQLVEILKAHQSAKENIVESAKSIANPLLVHDVDAGIDENKLLQALKKGYKRIIVGKTRDGDINFKAPGSLPIYAQHLPDQEEEKISKYLGVNESFFGKSGAARERGAISRLQQSSFRSLKTIAQVLDDAFSELDLYLLDFLKAHQIKMSKDLKLQNLEEIFNPGGIKYIPLETLQAFSLQDTRENKVLSLAKWKAKLIPQKISLIEQGYTQPRRIIKQVREEAEAIMKLAAQAREAPAVEKSVLDQVNERLKGKLRFEYWLSPLAMDKILVKVNKKDVELSAFLLSDLSQFVLVQKVLLEEKPPVEQQSLKPKEQPIGSTPAASPLAEKLASLGGGIPKVPASIPVPVPGQKPGRPTAEIPTSEQLVSKELKGAVEKTPVTSPLIGKKKIVEPTGFNEAELGELVKARKIIGKIEAEKYLKYPGLYIVEPHAKWIHEGKKLLLLKAKKFDIINKSYLLCGKLVYGVITIKKIIDKFNFDALEKYHLVTQAQKERWWKDSPLYLYEFKYDPFEKPLSYVRESGVQTFIKEVKISEGTGVPQTGDLKPRIIKPKDIPPSHKPEKKAFQPHEVFSLERLNKIIPESKYDVSEKMDGVRCFGWVVDGVASLYSDEGNKFADLRVQPILDMLVTKFKHNVLLDGEIVLRGIERKDITGYLHSKKIPTPDELKALQYVVWDILYVKDKSIANIAFSKRSSILDLYIPAGARDIGVIRRVHHKEVNRPGVPAAVKSIASTEGAVIRELNASYWATHSTYKFKYMWDVDAKVIAIEKTKVGIPMYYCVLRDGTYIGQTYASLAVKAKVGDVIRVNVDHITIRPDGSINWYSPKPKNIKEGKVTVGKGLTQIGIGGPDTLDLAKEIYLASGGTDLKWKLWLPLHKKYKEEVMPKKIAKLKGQKESVPTGKA